MLNSPWFRWPLLAGLVLTLGAFALLGANASGLSLPRRTLDEQVALIRPHTEIRLPETASTPVPAVLLFHGCGGLRQVQEDYAAAFLEAGYGVVIVGSNAARDIGRFGSMSQVCAALRLWGQERAADIHAAIEIARAEPGIDDDRLAIIGWSHGGWTALDALSFAGEGRLPPSLESGDPGLPGVRLVLPVYPYCGFPAHTDGTHLPATIPVRAILAANDQIAPPRDCVGDFERAATAGADIGWGVWGGLTHAFDEPNAPPLDPRIRYDEAAASQARERVLSWLDEALDDESASSGN